MSALDVHPSPAQPAPGEPTPPLPTARAPRSPRSRALLWAGVGLGALAIAQVN